MDSNKPGDSAVALDTSAIIPRGRGALRTILATYLHDELIYAVGGIIVLVALVLAVAGPWIVPYNPLTPDSNAVSQPPSFHHWFGTDNSGLDVFSRVIASPSADVLIAVAAAIVSLVAGALIGLAVSYRSGWHGATAMRVADVVQSLPVYVLAMILVVTAGRSLVALVLVLSFLNVPIYIRLMRSQVLALRTRGFVEAARAVGVAEWRIALRHVLPNAIGPSLVQLSITIGWAIILTAGLSFVGAGIRPPTPEWGAMISVGANQLEFGEWWSSVFPGVALAITVFGFAVVGEGLGRVVRREE
jgi:peptide/nickel transport system permease protein